MNMLRRIALSLTVLLGLALPLSAWAAEQAAAPAENSAVTGAAEAGAGQEATAVAEHGKAEHQVVEWQPVTAIWVLVIFVILLIVLYPTAWKGVLQGLKSREERIRKDIADAEAARARAEATLREYNSRLAEAEDRVREMLTKATADGEALAAQVRLKAQQEAEQTKNRATGEIEAVKKQALSEIYTQTADLATKVAEKILRRTLRPEDQEDLVRASLQQLESAKK